MRFIIGLGGNVGDVRAAFDRAVATLRGRSGLEICSRSSLWRTVAVGPQQPRYLNAAILVGVESSPRDLLNLCQSIEVEAGRNRGAEQLWGPRTLDLDILIADSLICRGPVLELPHPHLGQRAFALVPAAELAPGWVHPFGGLTLAVMAEQARFENPNAIELAGAW